MVVIRLIEINVFEMFAPEFLFGGILFSHVQEFCMQQHPGRFLAASFPIEVV
jgi:hypothetical protein